MTRTRTHQTDENPREEEEFRRCRVACDTMHDKQRRLCSCLIYCDGRAVQNSVLRVSTLVSEGPENAILYIIKCIYPLSINTNVIQERFEIMTLCIGSNNSTCAQSSDRQRVFNGCPRVQRTQPRTRQPRPSAEAAALLPQPRAAVMCCEAGVASAALLLQPQRRVTSPPSRSVPIHRNSRLHVAAAGSGKEHLRIFFFITREPIKTPLCLFAFYLDSLIHLMVRRYFFFAATIQKREKETRRVSVAGGVSDLPRPSLHCTRNSDARVIPLARSLAPSPARHSKPRDYDTQPPNGITRRGPSKALPVFEVRRGAVQHPSAARLP